MMIEDDIHIYTINLPCRVKGFTVPDDDGYSVYLNARCTREQNRRTLAHEISHIHRGDFYCNDPVGSI